MQCRECTFTLNCLTNRGTALCEYCPLCERIAVCCEGEHRMTNVYIFKCTKGKPLFTQHYLYTNDGARRCYYCNPAVNQHWYSDGYHKVTDLDTDKVLYRAWRVT